MMFESHITCLATDRIPAGMVAERFGWKTSQIAGDPVLGPETFFYLTDHQDGLITAQARMAAVVSALLDKGIQVIRRKIEVDIYDNRELLRPKYEAAQLFNA